VQSHFRVAARREDRSWVLRLIGELDLASSPALEQALERTRGCDAELVIVDLRELDFMDSSGLNVLVKAHQHAQESGTRFALVRGRSHVQRLLSITGLDERLMVVDSSDELLSVG
jgi:anti-anti-sigma factor